MTPNEEPVPEPENVDSIHWPSTKRDATINQKYGFKETFVRVPFTGTTKKMAYTRPEGMSANRKKTQRKRKRSPTRQGHPTMPVGPQKVGGPNTIFLGQYGLNKMSHPMDWFTAFMPLTPDANLEDLAIANMKGDKTTKFAVSNWTAYLNTKAMLNNSGEEGHIFAGKHWLFTPTRTLLQCLVCTPSMGWLRVCSSCRRCSLSQSSQHMATTRSHCASGRDTNRRTVPSGIFLHARIL